MRDCLREVEVQRQGPLDIVLAHMVQTQLVVEKASVAALYDSTFDFLASNGATTGLFVRSLQADLDKIRAPRLANSQHDRKF